jgi:hypothetical protein
MAEHVAERRAAVELLLARVVELELRPLHKVVRCRRSEPATAPVMPGHEDS